MNRIKGLCGDEISPRPGPWRRRPAAHRGVLFALLMAGLPGLLAAAGGTRSEEEVEAKLLASDGAPGDAFGHSVSLSGTTALVGAFLADGTVADRGSAYVFVRGGGGWKQQAKLAPPVGAVVNSFGFSVALSGETALVGAELENGNGTVTTAGYVYVRQNGAWTHQAVLKASTTPDTDWFHVSLALAGDTALIGTWRDDTNGFLAGSAVVFVRDGSSWSQQAKLLPSDGEAYDAFGFQVGLTADTALVGALGDDDNGTFAGAAYTFARSGDVWTEQAKLLASDGEPFDNLGDSVALSGDTALVGASRESEKGAKAGAAYVFVRNGGAWSQQAKLLASDGTASDTFGAVSVFGDTALIGARHHDTASGVDAGAAYLFTRAGAEWSEVAKLEASDGGPFDAFGHAVSTSAETYLVGARFDDENGSDSGSAYVIGPQGLTLSATGTCPGTVTLTLTNATPGSEVGVVAAANNSGFTKGGALCAGTTLEIGEPFKLPPVWIKTDAAGNGGASTVLPADRCWLEAMALAGCETSGALEVD